MPDQSPTATQATTPPPEDLQVEIINPDSTLFQGPAEAVSSINKQGKFDILPTHTHFISLIKDQVIVHTAEHTSKKFNFKQGLLRCFDNQIKIYIGL